MNQTKEFTNKKVYLILWGLCILGSWSVLPYILYLDILPPTDSVFKIFLLTTVQSAFFFGVACKLASWILPKTDLEPFCLTNPLHRIAYPGIISGVLVGLTIFFLDRTLFASSVFSGVHPPIWAGAIGSIYGAVNEEVLLRLFLFTLIYYFSRKITDRKLLALWTVNVAVALLFGLGHLPIAYQIASPSAFEISRILLLNAIPGVVFGWLYWSRSLWTAMCAHFVTDLMVHVFLA